ncbi:MAG: carbon-nitrogen hydrolase family protein [Granulosicoccus sp.]
MSDSNIDNADASESLRLAVAQHVPTPNAVEQSLQRIDNLATQASDSADLLLLPEASLTGYNVSLDIARLVAVSRSSDCTETIQTICQRANMAIAYGYIERDGETLFNAVHVIDASGNSVAHYRKCHLWGELDQRLFTAGNSLSPVFTLHGWQLGLLICYDVEFPEAVRHLTLQGAQVIIAPTALMQPWTFVAEHMSRVRAAENQVYFAYANYCGSENDIDYVGLSCIVAPDGDDMARAGSHPELLQATLTRAAISDIRALVPYHVDRRPELYSLNP